MEPGHEDREYPGPPVVEAGDLAASMEPGHEDREYLLVVSARTAQANRLNGARS